MIWCFLSFFVANLLAWLADPRAELVDFWLMPLVVLLMAPVYFLIWLAGELLPSPWGRGPAQPRGR